jgi:hypothetical protein
VSPAPRPEAAFTKQAIDLAHIHGWHVAHFSAARVGKDNAWVTPVRADGKGFPDLVLVRERVVYAELKMPGRKLEPAQTVWQAKLLGAGQEYYVWEPGDLDDHMKRVLAERRPTASTVTVPP